MGGATRCSSRGVGSHFDPFASFLEIRTGDVRCLKVLRIVDDRRHDQPSVAKPIQDAHKKGAADDFAKYYLLSLSGTPMDGAPTPPFGDDDADPRRPSREQMQANMKQSTTLQIKGKAPLKPERIEPSETGIMFLFSRDDHPIKREDKEVIFQTKLGPLELKARFALKDMLYHDRLEL